MARLLGNDADGCRHPACQAPIKPAQNTGFGRFAPFAHARWLTTGAGRASILVAKEPRIQRLKTSLFFIALNNV
ncbi:hypothetical protein K6L44_10480 [Gluconacetobacter entanii]|uniref:hypothetical protein n=1 Tax=Gluconacetobacter entanii TaxID=108528 RepID=UPI00142DBED4|nr:hypothetical protein [Gluconacetobacter entanii]MBY4640399.1 hypothetical protein [Gluconacetobacter entanii]MCE2580054.1 hypothetical protein [Komagataeibacter sp. FNDCR1]MCW4580921.1 hypothetical protein [Gluconacetobacter entanii]MCW4587659.1 hypothetical protein [Gluconacetobacter entanii]